MKYEDDIHNCTNDRLAEMLEKQADSCFSLCGQIEHKESDRELLLEAAARLREKHKVPFNSEAFE